MIIPGVYKHYKGGYYRVLFVAKNSNNSGHDEDVVVYVSLSEPGRISVRNADEFDEIVSFNDSTLTTATKRFTKVGN